MVKCPKCKKEFKSSQGLAGHMRMMHNVKLTKNASILDTDEDLTAALKAIHEALDLLTDKMAKVEIVASTRKTYPSDR
jgi:histidinol phosphatase-like enzyme